MTDTLQRELRQTFTPAAPRHTGAPPASRPTMTATAVVTGASAGIGHAAAIALARAGYHVIAAARRLEPLQALADASDGRIIPLPVDVASDRSVADFADQVRDRLRAGGISTGVPDVLVNNAGYAVSGPVEGLPVEALRRQFETNVFGLHAVTRAFATGMRLRGSGRIINISSLVGKVAFPFQGPYCASKHAVEALSDALRIELAPFGVRVVLIEPGPIRTEFADVLSAHVACDPDVAPAYPGLAGLNALFANFYKSAPGPEAVADAVLRAATARRPWARYRVPSFQVGAAIRFFGILPTSLADLMKRQIYRAGPGGR